MFFTVDDREKSHTLIMQATFLYSSVAKVLTPEYQELFTKKDVFNKKFCVNFEKRKRKVVDSLFSDEINGVSESKEEAPSGAGGASEEKKDSDATEEFEEEIIVTSSASTPPPSEEARSKLTIEEWNTRQVTLSMVFSSLRTRTHHDGVSRSRASSC